MGIAHSLTAYGLQIKASLESDMTSLNA